MEAFQICSRSAYHMKAHDVTWQWDRPRKHSQTLCDLQRTRRLSCTHISQTTNVLIKLGKKGNTKIATLNVFEQKIQNCCKKSTKNNLQYTVLEYQCL